MELISKGLFPEHKQLFQGDVLLILSDYLMDNNHYVEGIVVDEEKVNLRFRRRDNKKIYKDLYVCDLPPTLLEWGPEGYESFVSLVNP